MEDILQVRSNRQRPMYPNILSYADSGNRSNVDLINLQQPRYKPLTMAPSASSFKQLQQVLDGNSP